MYVLIKVEPFTMPSRFPALAENPDDTYVLQLEGVHESHCNPSLDWSRYLAPNVPVPLDRKIHDRSVLTSQLTRPLFITYSTGR